jgi:hypothetical protein
MTSTWSRWHTAGLLLLTILVFVLCYFVPIAGRLYLWWGVMVLLTATAVIIGQGITGQLTGILIDNRNKMSLSRLQLAMWTVLIVSAFVVFFFWRLKVIGAGNALDFSIPETIWGLLGISSASLAGSSLIKTTKKNQTPNVQEESETARKMTAQGQDPSTQLITGRAVLNEMTQQASWADLFRGEESGNASTMSVGKFQMFYFTIVAVMSYGYAVAAMFGAHVPGKGFPEVSLGLLGLLGISHAGYLAEKAVPHTQDPAPEPAAAPVVPVVPAPVAAPAPVAPASVVPAAPAPAATVVPVATIRRTARRMGQM